MEQNTLLAMAVALGAIVVPLIFWYHLSGIHKQAKRAADSLQSIEEYVQMQEARVRASGG